jgi:hypothetical protein
MDDVLVHGMNQNLHDTRLEAILQKLKETGITLNAEKCEFSRNKVKFIGHIIDADGIGVDPDKIQAIKDLNPPSNVLDVRRFLGMVNQLSKFSGRLALLTEPLRELLKKKNEWSWGHLQESAFRDIKFDAVFGTL